MKKVINFVSMSKKKTDTVAIELEVTQEEKDLVFALTEGKSAARMAIKMGTTESLLASKLASIRAKYDCDNSVQLVAYFLRNGLIK